MKPCASAEEWVGGNGKFIEVGCDMCGYKQWGPECSNCLVDVTTNTYEKLINLLTKEGKEK